MTGTVEAEFEEFERRELSSTLAAVIRLRFILLVVIASLATWISVVDPTPWRRVVLVVLVVALASLDVQTRRRFQRRGLDPANVRYNLAAMVVLQAILVFVTGGLESPLVPVMVPPAFAVGLMMGRRGFWQLVAGVQIPAILAFFVLHLSGVLPDFVPQPFAVEGGPRLAKLVLIAVAAATAVAAVGTVGGRLRSTLQRHLSRIAHAQDVALAANRQRVDELTLLSGEIAHELKNPLASVKGLTQLMERSSKQGEDGKLGERLAVLGREVGRMQAILDEFLNFSRPLTPLERREVAVKDLCRDVAMLHEAMSAERGVELVVDAPDDLRLPGDARKIAQVLVNLLQNALDAAPRGSVVRIRVRGEGDVATLEVIDAGPGLDPEIAARAFEPGVTDKASGHGLGLTVARGIAQQHGGTLELESAPDAGCRAVLTLPLVATESEDAA